MDQRIGLGKEILYEYIVLGAGPAGLQMGHHLSRAGHSTLILEAGDTPGHFFKTFPRHRTLLSTNKAYTGLEDPELNLRHDQSSILSDEDRALLFKDYSRRYFPLADEMVRYLSDYADHFGLNVRLGTRILRVEKAHGFRLTDAQGNVFACRRLIVATGLSKPYVPDIPGIGLAENYADVSVDPEDFLGQRVLILGKGNSAFETADALVSTTALVHMASPNPVKLARKTRYAGLLDCTVERIERQGKELVVSVRSSRAPGEIEKLRYDRVIVATGFRFDSSIFAEGCRPELVLDNRFPAQTSEWESVNVPGLYFAGTLMQANGFERSATASIHGFRYDVRSLFRMLEKKHHRKGWLASRDVEPTPEGLVEAVLARLNKSSALWHQHGYLHDVLVVHEGWSGATYYEEMPLAYVQDAELGENDHYYTVSLEFGMAEESRFLHPVIRRWCGRRLLSEKHLPEDLFSEWKKPEAHIAPLRYFFLEQLLESATLAMDFGVVEGEYARVAV